MAKKKNNKLEIYQHNTGDNGINVGRDFKLIVNVICKCVLKNTVDDNVSDMMAAIPQREIDIRIGTIVGTLLLGAILTVFYTQFIVGDTAMAPYFIGGSVVIAAGYTARAGYILLRRERVGDEIRRNIVETEKKRLLREVNI